MRIFLIRHAETAWTLSGQHTGKTDLELTTQGRQEAQLLGERLGGYSFEKVLCSPLKRAKETCRLAGFLEQAILTPDLIEWDYGKYEGLTTQEIHAQDPEWDVFACGSPGGESVGDVTTRAQKVLNLLLDLQGDAALFSSGHFLRALAAIWLKFTAAEGSRFALFPASLSILGYERSTPVILLWNST